MPAARGPSTSGPQVSPTNSVSGGGQAAAVEGVVEDAGMGLAGPGLGRGDDGVDQAVEADAGHRPLEVPVPVGAHGQHQSPPAELGQHRRPPRRRRRGCRSWSPGGGRPPAVRARRRPPRRPGPGCAGGRAPRPCRRPGWPSARRAPRRRPRPRPTGCPTPPPARAGPGGRRSPRGSRPTSPPGRASRRSRRARPGSRPWRDGRTPSRRRWHCRPTNRLTASVGRASRAAGGRGVPAVTWPP